MPTNICDILETQIRETYKNRIQEEDVSSVSSALLNFRDIVDYLEDSPSFVFNSINSKSELSKLCYPCDLIELHTVLGKEAIDSPSIALFPIEFSTKFFLSYSVFLVLKPPPDCINLGNLAIIESPFLIKDYLLEILINQVSNPHALTVATEAVGHSNLQAPVSGFNRVPGLSLPEPRLAQGYNAKKTRLQMKIAQSPISLTPYEQSIFNVLRDVKQAIGVNVEMRVAGGFVRDKLLGLESDDIDIAISHMSGFEFAQLIEQYAREHSIDNIGKAYRVSLEKSADPDAKEGSDDLMVGGISINGQKIELVPMRTEEYDPGSRTPRIARTDDVRDDVLRRDLSINAIYYNIATGQVEDYVGGLEDLRNMHLRTPTDPVKTFTEDPLRVLRALRFYSRYPNATLDQGIVDAMTNPQVIEAYQNKVAPERAGPELMKMMAGAQPAAAVRLLFETDFYKTAFNVPEMEGLNPVTMDQQTPHHKFSLMEHTLQVLENYNKSAVEKDLPEDRRVMRNLAALFHDFGKMHPEIQTPHPKNPGQMQYLGHEEKSVEIADAIMKTIGIGSDQRQYVNKLVDMHMRPHSEKDKWTNKSMGRLMRSLDIPGQEGVSEALLEDLYDHGEADARATDPDTAEADVARKRQHYQQFVDFRSQQSQGPTALQKPLLNGHEVMQLIPELRPDTGFIKEVSDRLLEERYANPNLTKEEAIAFVGSIKPEIVQRYSMDKPSYNLSKNKKVAQNPLGQDNQGFEGFQEQEGGEWRHREPGDIVHPQQANYPYFVGQIVLQRGTGFGFGQGPQGKVEEVTPESVHVKWENNDKVEKIPNDVVTLAGRLQRVN